MTIWYSYTPSWRKIRLIHKKVIPNMIVKFDPFSAWRDGCRNIYSRISSRNIKRTYKSTYSAVAEIRRYIERLFYIAFRTFMFWLERICIRYLLYLFDWPNGNGRLNDDRLQTTAEIWQTQNYSRTMTDCQLQPKDDIERWQTANYSRKMTAEQRTAKSRQSTEDNRQLKLDSRQP